MKPFFRPLAALATLFLFASCGEPPQTPTGELFVLTSPEGAIVEVNNRFLGITPIQGEPIPSGPTLITIRKEGYRTEYLSLRMVTGQRVSREVDLEPLAGLVLIDSDPPGANVTIEDAYMGKTPLALHEIELGEHRARLELLGYDNKEIEFTVKDRIPKRQLVDMVSNSGTLVVHSEPSGATVYVDGRNEGLTPQSLDRIERGERTVSLEMAGYTSYKRAVLISPDEVARVDATLQPLPGTLTVVTVPDKARVYINGEPRGESPLTLEDLRPGAYSVRVTKRGHADAQRTVRVDRGEEVIEELELERNSGTLQIVTRPAGVRVNIDGEYMGTTTVPEGRSDRVSLPLQVEMLSRGSHTLQLVREGYTFENKRFFIQKDEVTTLEETLRRKFIPDVLVRTGEGQDNMLTGVLIRKHLNGDLELEIRPGVFRTIRADEIVSVEPLKQEETLED